jgi:hypothetical protein
MTNRYELLINSIHASDSFIVQMFLFAFFVVISYRSLQWLPDGMRRPMQNIFLAFVLAAFILVTVYFWNS